SRNSYSRLVMQSWPSSRRSLRRTLTTAPCQCWPVRRRAHPSGYLRVSAHGKAWSLSRLVYTWFAGEPAGKVRHIATCAWKFRCGNPLHYYVPAKRKRARRVNRRKLSAEQLQRLRRSRAKGATLASLSKRYGVSITTVARWA